VVLRLAHPSEKWWSESQGWWQFHPENIGEKRRTNVMVSGSKNSSGTSWKSDNQTGFCRMVITIPHQNGRNGIPMALDTPQNGTLSFWTSHLGTEGSNSWKTLVCWTNNNAMCRKPNVVETWMGLKNQIGFTWLDWKFQFCSGRTQVNQQISLDLT